ncbi:MAG: GumC family protein [Verrucomicrobiales bacterium]|nr:hypothetical protein [Nitrospinaceae bacterium]
MSLSVGFRGLMMAPKLMFDDNLMDFKKDNNDEIDLVSYWAVIRREKRIVLLSVLFSLVLVLTINYFTRPVYESTSQIIIRKEQRRSPLTGEVVGDQDKMAYETAVALISNRMMLGRVADTLSAELDLQEQRDKEGFIRYLKFKVASMLRPVLQFVRELSSPEAPITPSDEISEELRQERKLDRHMDVLKRLISVEPVPDTRLVNIRVEHYDPLFAKEIASTLVASYIGYQAEQKEAKIESLTAYLGNQLSDMEGRIEESERAFYAFKDQKVLFSLEGKLHGLTERIGRLNNAYVKTKTERLAIEARLVKVTESIKNNNVEKWGQLPVKSVAVDALRRDLMLAQIRLVKAEETFKSQHPKLKIVKSEILSIQHSIQEEVSNVITRLESEKMILKSRERHLKSAIVETEEEMHGINKSALQYSTLEREFNTNRDLYSLLLTKLKESDLTGKLEVPVVHLLIPATRSSFSISPKKGRNIALGLVTGMMFGIGIAFLKERLWTPIRTPQDVYAQLQLPVLGMIPRME